VTLQSQGRRRPGRGQLERQIAALAPWFHNLHLPGGVQTAPDHPLGDYPAFKWRQVEGVLPAALHGWRALDLGCNAGFYTFELARRGAEVVGIDTDEHYLTQARWAAGIYELDHMVEFRRMHVYDLARSDERFDLVLFMGVLYHLRYPLLALDVVAERVDRLLVLQTLTMPGEETPNPWRDLPFDRRDQLTEPWWPKMAFVERNLANDPTNWWVPNAAAVEAMARAAGLEVVARPGDEIYVCRPLPGTNGEAEGRRAEVDRATGRRT
jgi:tRNA (mo5U34)-methyltransferase